MKPLIQKSYIMLIFLLSLMNVTGPLNNNAAYNDNYFQSARFINDTDTPLRIGEVQYEFSYDGGPLLGVSGSFPGDNGNVRTPALPCNEGLTVTRDQGINSVFRAGQSFMGLLTDDQCKLHIYFYVINPNGRGSTELRTPIDIRRVPIVTYRICFVDGNFVLRAPDEMAANVI